MGAGHDDVAHVAHHVHDVRELEVPAHLVEALVSFVDLERRIAPSAFDRNFEGAGLAPESRNGRPEQLGREPRQPGVATLRVPHDEDVPLAHPVSLRWTSCADPR